MRIAVTNWCNIRVGGTESYLAEILPALHSLGHEVLFGFELRHPGNLDAVASDTPSVCLAEQGVAAIQEWRPDVIYHHGFASPELESKLEPVSPTVYFVHAHAGICISGTKTHSFPEVQPCSKALGPACLLHYFPRRCGGLNPWTMVGSYRTQRLKLTEMRQMSAVITHSDYMQAELRRNGVDASVIRYHVGATEEKRQRQADPYAELADPDHPARVLFLGRMDPMKGGQVLLPALALLQARPCRPVHLTFAGDGLSRKAWEALSRQLGLAEKVQFTGWLSVQAARDALLSSHLLVVPSLWPEPFGRVGPEAGALGVPVVAFDVGGVSQWLSHDVNGLLVRPSTPAALAEAIHQCIADPARLVRYSAAGIELAKRFTIENHLADLLPVLESVTQR